jgi:hypothetical protein
MHAYDLVNTLAAVTYPSETLTEVLYKPAGAFTVITAQDAGSHSKLYAQLKEALPNCQRIHTVLTGTDKQEGQRKARVLKRINATSYTDDNANILAVIRTQLPDLPLYLIKNGRRRRCNG